jgi:hypothetical protein
MGAEKTPLNLAFKKPDFIMFLLYKTTAEKTTVISS